MMDLNEFIRDGYLQELNRNFLHVLGLALVVERDKDKLIIKGIWDCRNDPDGILFVDLDQPENYTMAASIDDKFETCAMRRRMKLGFSVQPLGHKCG